MKVIRISVVSTFSSIISVVRRIAKFLPEDTTISKSDDLLALKVRYGFCCTLLLSILSLIGLEVQLAAYMIIYVKMI